MNTVKGHTIIIPRLKPKYKQAVTGSYEVGFGLLCFRSGKDIVYIQEHFSDKNGSLTDLVENTVRYDGESEKTKETIEKRDETCYNDAVNDVL